MHAAGTVLPPETPTQSHRLALVFTRVNAHMLPDIMIAEGDKLMQALYSYLFAYKHLGA